MFQSLAAFVQWVFSTARVGFPSIGLFSWFDVALRAPILLAWTDEGWYPLSAMSKKKSKKVTVRRALPGASSWSSLWRGVSKSLRSKKFLAAAGAVLIAVSQGDWNAVFVVTMVYLGAQGVVDTAKAIRR